MDVGIERFADGIDGGHPMVGEKTFELALDQLEPGEDRGDILRGCGGLKSQFQVIQQRKEVREDRLVCVFERFLFFAGQAFSGVFKIGPDTEELIFQ